MKKHLLLFSLIITIFIGKFSLANAQTMDTEADNEEVTAQQLYLENLQLKNQLLQYQLKLQQLQQSKAEPLPIPTTRLQQYNAIQR